MQVPFALSRGYTKNSHVENFGPKIMQGERNHDKLSKIFLYFFSYHFDGSFVNGKINGSGTLKIDSNAPQQQRCLYLNQIPLNLTEPPDTIQGIFDEGSVFGIANLTWNSLGLRVETHMSYGMIHGMFKAFDLLKTGKAMIGYASRNFVDEKSWMIEDNLVNTFKNLEY